MAKFPALGDPFDDPRVEAVCLSLAAAAGIEVPKHDVMTVAGKSVLLVQRFDRTPAGHRIGYISAATVVEADPTAYYAPFTYFDIARRAQLAGIEPCGRQIFQRLLFDCFIHNTDGHLRNTGFTRAAGGQWKLSPAFDLSVHNPNRLVLAPAAGMPSDPNPATAFGAHNRFRVSRQAAEEIYDGMVGAMRQVPAILDRFEVRLKDREVLSGMWTHALNPPTLSSPALPDGPETRLKIPGTRPCD
jgi:serine/threonine-protein kinase HipA